MILAQFSAQIYTANIPVFFCFFFNFSFKLIVKTFLNIDQWDRATEKEL